MIERNSEPIEQNSPCVCHILFVISDLHSHEPEEHFQVFLFVGLALHTTTHLLDKTVVKRVDSTLLVQQRIFAWLETTTAIT